jgi:hypothetical protein
LPGVYAMGISGKNLAKEEESTMQKGFCSPPKHILLILRIVQNSSKGRVKKKKAKNWRWE